MAYAIPFDYQRLGYHESLDVLHDRLRLGISPMLESVEDMLDELGRPDLTFECVQVAGTNGKTSTTRYTASILRAHGFATALYTSPELVDYTERMEVDGAPVTPELFAQSMSAAIEAGERVNRARRAADERPYDITEFDLLTVAALVAFALSDVDVAVLECGMGGRWDATSAAGSIRSVAVTGIGLDHTRVLGNTLEAIAGEKAAIIKSHRTCVLGPGVATPTSVEDVFLDQAAHAGVTPLLLRPATPDDRAGVMHPGTPADRDGLPQASYAIRRVPEQLGGSLIVDVTTPRATYEGLSALKPIYQAPNIATAVCLAESYLGRALDADRTFDAVVTCPTPGRFDVRSADPLVMVDAAHNPQSIASLLASVRSLEPDVQARPALLAAVLADKDVEGIVRLLSPEFPRVYVTQTSSERALPAPELARIFQDAGANVVGTYGTVDEALAALCEESFLACGSITLAGEVVARLR